MNPANGPALSQADMQRVQTLKYITDAVRNVACIVSAIAVGIFIFYMNIFTFILLIPALYGTYEIVRIHQNTAPVLEDPRPFLRLAENEQKNMIFNGAPILRVILEWMDRR